MILIVANYKGELEEKYFEKYSFLEIKFLNERKGSIFALKLQKHLMKNKYDLVLHFGICGGNNNDIGNIYKIEKSFLYYLDIIDNQKFKHGNYSFNSISNSNIVTKFFLDKNDDKIYDFASIYDLETFWIGQLSNFINIPIFSIKGVSDSNELYDTNYDFNNEIELLLDPSNKRKRKELYFEYIKNNIKLINNNFINFFENDFLGFYDNYINNKSFRDNFLHGKENI